MSKYLPKLLVQVNPKFRYLLKNTQDAYTYINKIPAQKLNNYSKSEADLYVQAQMNSYSHVASLKQTRRSKGIKNKLTSSFTSFSMIEMIMNNTENIRERQKQKIIECLQKLPTELVISEKTYLERILQKLQKLEKKYHIQNNLLANNISQITKTLQNKLTEVDS